MSLAEGQVALCPAVASGGHDLEQRDLGLAAGNSSVLNAELMAQKPAFCWYLCLLDDLKNLFGFLCLKMELVRTLLGQKRAIICLRVSMVLAVPLDELSHSGSDSGLINNSFVCLCTVGSGCLCRRSAKSFPLLLGPAASYPAVLQCSGACISITIAAIP